MRYYVTRYTFTPYFSGYYQEGNFHCPDGKILEEKYYNGRLCIDYKRKRYGIIKLRKFAKQKQVLIEKLPF